MTVARRSERVNADQRSAPDPGAATRKLLPRPPGAGAGAAAEGEKKEPGKRGG